MTTTPDVYKIPKLSDSNYHTWAIRARAALVQKGVWEAVEHGYGVEMTEEQKRANDKALTFLFLVVDDTYLDDIGSMARAKDAWVALEEINMNYGLLHILQLMRDFFNVRMKKEETINSYLARIMDIYRKLERCGHSFKDKEIALIMLLGLPEQYEPLIMNLEHEEDGINTKLVKSRLLIEEKRLSRRAEYKKQNTEDSDDQTRALVAKGKQKKADNRKTDSHKDGTKHHQKSDGRQTTKRVTVCYCCGQVGHIAKHCPRKAETSNGETDDKTPRVSKDKAFCVKEQGSVCPKAWYLDTGATDHMSSCKEIFLTFKSFTSTVEVANKEKMKVEGKGDVKIMLKEENGGWNITLLDVLYVPDLESNLISVGKIEESGCCISFDDGKATVFDEDGKTIILTAKREGRLYSICEKESEKSFFTKSSAKNLWHRPLGHINYAAVGKLPEMVKQEELDHSAEGRECSVCIKAKMKARPFPKGGATRASGVLELINSDVVGKINQSRN